MQLTGRLFMVGTEHRTIPVGLTLDDELNIADASGDPVGVVPLRFLKLERTSDQTFLLHLGARSFGFTADAEPEVVTEFADRIISVAADHHDLASTNGSVEVPSPLPPVEELPPIGGWDEQEREYSGATPGPSISRRLEELRREGVLSRAAVEALPIEAAPPEESAEEPVEEGRRRVKPIRLDPRMAARLGLPLKPLRGGHRSDGHSSVKVGGGLRMAYRAEGQGRPVILLGGGIGSMDIWRGVVPHISTGAQVISIDLIGFGGSDRIPEAEVGWYDWETHVGYLDACFEALGLDGGLTIIGHGWNTIVALEWARLNSDRIRALGYVDPILRPVAWSELDPWLREAIKRARRMDPEDMEYLSGDGFLADALGHLLQDAATPQLFDAYRRAMGPPGPARFAHLAAIAQLPVGGEPRNVSAMMQECSQWLKTAEVPKLLILGRPGFLLVRRARSLASRLPHQTVATVDGIHLLAETSPDPIGRFLQLWLRSV